MPPDFVYAYRALVAAYSLPPERAEYQLALILRRLQAELPPGMTQLAPAPYPRQRRSQ